MAGIKLLSKRRTRSWLLSRWNQALHNKAGLLYKGFGIEVSGLVVHIYKLTREL